ncbi:hypothetical protein Nepgr_015120 [Nepenthes gracilis]|uniref:Nijmegen breakage syndrome 1 protein n=1 Tax=Nepenthes gracilis TaxID=150966 RepID=A0AAD3SMC0_NEPGR|nr:hypothetical protein Nepgr_015120 [Nepenthes gracilis]
MVWGLFPADPLSGEDKYFIFSKGTYQVGRKGCDVTISKDKGVSRIHAEIFVDAMDCLANQSSSVTSNVRIRDCSKYGTFIGQNLSSKEKVHECQGKLTSLKDGDLISFGTGNATFRFSFVPLIFYICNIEDSQTTSSIQEKVSSIGACTTHKWTEECTHIIVDQYTPLNEDLIDAIMTKKPLVVHNWLEFFTENKICSEIASCSFYVPTLIVDGTSVKVADSKTRETCLKGYSFLLESAHMYKYGNRLPLLLEVSGAKVLSIDIFDSNSQDLEDGQSNRVVHVIPTGSADRLRNRGSLLKINEMDLISCIILGHLDPSVLKLSVVVSSSCSTDDTVVADSDAETESATSDHPAAATASTNAAECQSKAEKSRNHAAPSLESAQMTNLMECNNKMASDVNEPAERESKGEISKDVAASASRHLQIADFIECNNKTVVRGEKDNLPESGNPDILYSQNLIVRDVNSPISAGSATDDTVINFKRFRKTVIESGNSFKNLVPFAKNPYTDSDYENKEVIESVREEKRRKQMEAMAEDLFNNEKGRRRGVAGSLHGLLASR